MTLLEQLKHASRVAISNPRGEGTNSNQFIADEGLRIYQSARSWFTPEQLQMLADEAKAGLPEW